MFILHPLENHSSGGELRLECQVIGGQACTGDSIRFAVRCALEWAALDPSTDEWLFDHHPEESYPVNLTVKDIRVRKHHQFQCMSAGHRGSFHLTAQEAEGRRIADMVKSQQLQGEVWTRSALYLFDSESSAQAQTRLWTEGPRP